MKQLAQLNVENAQLRAHIANLKKAEGVSKTQDAYRRKLYNEMVDTLVDLKKINRKEIHSHHIDWYTHDMMIKESIRPVRVFERRRMTKNPRKLVDSKYPEK